MRRAILLCIMLTGAATAQLTAGDIDDHLNWESYLDYLQDQQDSRMPDVTLQDRVTLTIEGNDGEPLAYADVDLHSDQGDASLQAGSDGILRLFPDQDGYGTGEVQITIHGAATHVETIDLADGDTTVVVDEPGRDAGSLQVMFVIDTTGSMSDELSYITTEIGDIAAQVQGTIEYGLTVYRDEGDTYVANGYGFTSDITEMRAWLDENIASGGGDYPESMQEGLKVALDAQWDPGNVAKLVFLVADAPPHSRDYDAMVDQIMRARSMGVHIHSLAASGVADEAEYLMRLASVLTQGRYAFLTDDSGIGNSHAEPHIPCYVVTTLDDLFVRIIQSEANGERVEASEAQTIREVGEQEHGVCLESEAIEGQDRGSMDSSPEMADEGASMGMETSEDRGIGHYEGSSGDDAMEGGGEPADAEESRSQPIPSIPLMAIGLFALVVWIRRS